MFCCSDEDFVNLDSTLGSLIVYLQASGEEFNWEFNWLFMCVVSRSALRGLTLLMLSFFCGRWKIGMDGLSSLVHLALKRYYSLRFEHPASILRCGSVLNMNTLHSPYEDQTHQGLIESLILLLLQFLNHGGQLLNVTTQNDIEVRTVWSIDSVVFWNQVRYYCDNQSFPCLRNLLRNLI